MDKRLAVILLAMGGPDSTSGIPEFLYNIFSDRSIIRLPGGAVLQKPFANIISKLRSQSVAHHYDLIGGSSPLLKWTEIQAEHIEKNLQHDFPGLRCYVGMRYYKPYIESAIEAAVKDGFEQLCFVPMYPQYSNATSGSSFLEVYRALKKYPAIEPVFVNNFHDDREYVEMLRDYISKNIAPDETLVFSAHSLPQKFVDEGDPYVQQTRRTAELAANSRRYYLAFQSRTGPVKWVGPDTIEVVKHLTEDVSRKLFIVPISFVCDHIETLYELDIQLKEIVGRATASRIRRMPMFNDDARLGALISNLVRNKVASYAGA